MTSSWKQWKMMVNGTYAIRVQVSAYGPTGQKVWDALCYATWYAADPTIKYFDNINEYNMCRKGRLTLPDDTVLDFDNMEITTSNPCISSSGCFQTKMRLSPLNNSLITVALLTFGMVKSIALHDSSCQGNAEPYWLLLTTRRRLKPHRSYLLCLRVKSTWPKRETLSCKRLGLVCMSSKMVRILFV